MKEILVTEKFYRYSYVTKFPCITKSNNPRWAFFTFLKLYKWYQIAQRIIYSQTNIYNIFYTKGLKFLTSLGLGLSHLNEQRFRLYFQDCLNPLRSSSLQISLYTQNARKEKKVC